MYHVSQSRSRGVLPQEPIYSYGIVMEVGLSEKEGAHNIAVFCFADGTWQLLNMIHDNFELLSGE